MKLRTELSWAIKQRVVVIPYRHFGTNYRPPKFLYEFTITRRVTARKSAILVHFAAEA